jgi:predicted RNA binding protein YcfA (HicA-like mRNA interferase family)
MAVISIIQRHFYALLGGVAICPGIRSWYEVAKVGSHSQFRHPDKMGRVTVPHPKKDLPIGTLKSIERQSGISFS